MRIFTSGLEISSCNTLKIVPYRQNTTPTNPKTNPFYLLFNLFLQNLLVTNFFLFQIMPQFKQVPKLHMICIKSIVASIVTLRSRIVSECWTNLRLQKALNSALDYISYTLLMCVPPNLYDLFVFHVITAMKQHLEHVGVPPTSWRIFGWHHQVETKIIKVLLNSKLRHLDLEVWPENVRLVFDENYSKLTGLVSLSLTMSRDIWDIYVPDYEDKILAGIKNMKNLRHVTIQYYCTDNIVKAISINCLQIRSIDLTRSSAVSNQSVKYLLKCKQLQKLYLNLTEISEKGYARLISHLPNLQNIGACSNIKRIVKHLNKRPYNQIKKLMIPKIKPKTLGLLVKYFPQLECLGVHIMKNNSKLDFNKIILLRCLRELRLVGFSTLPPSFSQALKIIGPGLEHFHLECCQSISLNFLVEIGNFCMNLNSLVLYQIDRVDVSEPVIESEPHAFAKLTRLVCKIHYNCKKPCKLILSKAININYVRLVSYNILNWSFLKNILRLNPMIFLTELIVFSRYNMEMDIAQMVLDSCPQLKVLSNSASWSYESSNISNNLDTIVRKNNLDLNVRTFWEKEPSCCKHFCN